VYVWRVLLSHYCSRFSQESRQLIRNFEFYATDPLTGSVASPRRVKLDVVFVSYNLVARDLPELLGLQNASSTKSFGCLVVDEGHRLKSTSVRRA
jgi:hypothetical protein